MSDQVVEKESAEAVVSNNNAGEPVYFNGDVTTVCKMVLKFTLLTILTLGIYRFWAKTKLRRYFWSQTEFDGDRFEYHGTPKELFIGFLIVVAILAPIIILSSVITDLLLLENQLYAVSFQGVYMIGFIYLIGLATFRVLRYRLSRTSWRSVRFGLDGNSWYYGFLALGVTVFSVLTLGIATPWLRNSLLKYRMSNLRFGDQHARYAGVGNGLARIWFIAWGVTITPFLVAAIYSAVSGEVHFTTDYLNESGQHAVSTTSLGVGEVLNLGAVLAVPLAILMFLWYRLAEVRYLARVTTFDGCSFQLNLSLVRVIGILLWIPVLSILFYLVLFLFVALIFGLFAGLSGLEFDEQTFSNPGILLQGMGLLSVLLMFVLGLSMVVAILVFPSVLLTGVIKTKLTQAILGSLLVFDHDDLLKITQAEQPEQKYGEGLADAFDVGAF